MTTANATRTEFGFIVSAEITARAVSLEDDAERAAKAVCAWLHQNPPAGNLAEWREEYRAAAEGETDVDQETTEYGLLLAAAGDVAQEASTRGWANPDATVFVDIQPA
jgi:hypothetical protein